MHFGQMVKQNNLLYLNRGKEKEKKCKQKSERDMWDMV